MPPSFWVASTKPEAALVRGQGLKPWQGRGWALAPRDRGPGAGEYCRERHLLTPLDEIEEPAEDPGAVGAQAVVLVLVRQPRAQAADGRGRLLRKGPLDVHVLRIDRCRGRHVVFP